MARIEETDYETIERTVERYQCDHCSAVVDEDEIHTVAYIQGDAGSTSRVLDQSVETEHHCEECVGVNDAISVREKRDFLRSRWEGIGEVAMNALTILLPVGAFALGAFGVIFVGWVEAEESVNVYHLVDPIMGAMVGVIMAIVATAVVLGILWVLVDE